MSRASLPLTLLLVACGGDDANGVTAPDASSDASSSNADAESARDAGGGVDAGAATDGALITAMGDPCRGIALPTSLHYVPQGMCARLVAGGLGNARQLAFAPNGDLFVASLSGPIHLLHDADGDGSYRPSEITTYGDTGGNCNNAHVDATGGFVYAGSNGGVVRFPYAPGMTSGGAADDVIINEPPGGHPYHTVHVYDGYLYVHSGSAGNAVNPMSPSYDTDRSLLRRFALSAIKSGAPLDWSTGEIVTQGLRNMAGYTRNAKGRMYGVVNGLDDIHYQGQDVHNDNPGEQILELGMGRKYGYPFCFTAARVVANGQVVAPGTQLLNEDFASGLDNAWCATNSSPPTSFAQAHSAPMDITFFDSAPAGGLPERFRGGAFISFHGSWDRSPATGYKVVWLPFDAQGNAPMPTSTATTTTFPYETVFGGGDATGGGPIDGAWNWSANGIGESPRPVGLAISPIDGALYIASDTSGNVYRIGLQR